MTSTLYIRNVISEMTTYLNVKEVLLPASPIRLFPRHEVCWLSWGQIWGLSILNKRSRVPFRILRWQNLLWYVGTLHLSKSRTFIGSGRTYWWSPWRTSSESTFPSTRPVKDIETGLEPTVFFGHGNTWRNCPATDFRSLPSQDEMYLDLP